MDRRIVITGLNMITSLGLNLKTSWENIIAGKSGIKKITLFDPSNNATQIAGEISKDFNELADEEIKKRTEEQMTRVTKMCYVCTKEAIINSELNLDNFDKTRCAVILGVVHTGNKSTENLEKNRIVKGMNNAMPAWISLKYKLEGPSYSVNTACASSAYAIAFGYDLIKNNMADLVIVGGADSTINPEEIQGFNEIFALSTQNNEPEKASRPFTKNRDGFVIGEGAGILILESLDSAKKRNARIYAEIAGYSLTNESYNIMAPMKDGNGMAKTMELALKNAHIKPENIGYINAHGTSTILNDKFETMAIKKVFNEYAYKIPISSIKSMLGHTIGAAGAIEAISTIMSIYTDILTPTINYDNPDPELDLDYIPNTSRKKGIEYAISNSFAFGGHNATLVFKRYNEN